MGVTVAALARDWRFWLGLALRIVLISAAAPTVQTQWFVPFLSAVGANGPAPWDGFLAAGGDPAAFPYGWPYLAAYFPGAWLGDLLAGPGGARLGLGLSVLAWDMVLAAAVGALAGKAYRDRAMALYWLSPLALYVGYWHGQLDVYPASLVALAFVSINTHRPLRAGAYMGIAIAAKLSMVLPTPLIALYYLGRARSRAQAGWMIGAAVVAAALLFLPLCLAPGFRTMVLQTPETGKIFSFALPIGPQLSLYILPLACLALIYVAWRLRRLDFEMLWTLTGVVFLAFLLLTPASPGWVMWSLPFLVLHVARSSVSGRVLYAVFVGSFVLLHLLTSSGASVFGGYAFNPFLAQDIDGPAGKAASVLFTIMLASGAALAVQMFRRGVLETPFRAATRRPLAIGVSGDSGAGKDTLVESMAGMFPAGALAHVSGDDYHLWDRHKPMWQAMTHLNPQANDLDTFGRHVRDLANGRAIFAPHYDHALGRMTKPRRVSSSEIVVASGLHALWSKSLNDVYDVRIYLDMDEDLRRFLKIKRDVHTRGHLEEKVVQAIDRRANDAARFIQPQSDAADIVIRLEPRHRDTLKAYSSQTSPPLRLIVLARTGEDFDQLARALASLCGIQAIERPLDSGAMEILIEGEPTAQDIAAGARRLGPHAAGLLAVEPCWQDGLKGVLQLVVLDQIDRACRRRSIAT